MLVARLSYHCSYISEKFVLIVYLHMKLCIFKGAKSDVCISPLFPNPVTYAKLYKSIQCGTCICVSSCYVLVVFV